MYSRPCDAALTKTRGRYGDTRIECTSSIAKLEALWVQMLFSNRRSDDRFALLAIDFLTRPKRPLLRLMSSSDRGAGPLKFSPRVEHRPGIPRAILLARRDGEEQCRGLRAAACRAQLLPERTLLTAQRITDNRAVIRRRRMSRCPILGRSFPRICLARRSIAGTGNGPRPGCEVASTPERLHRGRRSGTAIAVPAAHARHGHQSCGFFFAAPLSALQATCRDPRSCRRSSSICSR